MALKKNHKNFVVVEFVLHPPPPIIAPFILQGSFSVKVQRTQIFRIFQHIGKCYASVYLMLNIKPLGNPEEVVKEEGSGMDWSQLLPAKELERYRVSC